MGIMPSVLINTSELRAVQNIEITRGVSKRFDKAKVILPNPGGAKTGAFSVYDDVRIGTVNPALLMAGVDGYINVPYNAAYNFTNGSHFSLFIEVQTTDTAYKVVMGKIDGSSANLTGYALAINSGKIRGIVQSVATTKTCIVESTSTTCNDGEPHVIGMSWAGGSSAASMKLWIDGVEITSKTTITDNIGSDAFASAVALQIGTVTGASSPWGYFIGKVRMAHLFNTDLTAAQVKNLYYNGVSEIGKTNLKGLWMLESDAVDSSSTANNGTLNNKCAYDDNSMCLLNGSDAYLITSATMSYATTQAISLFSEIMTTDTERHVVAGAADDTYLSNAIEGYWLEINNGIIRGNFAERSGGTFTECIVESVTTVCNDGAPHLIGFTYDGSRTAAGMKLYIDGVEIADRNIISDDLESASMFSAQKFTIGHFTNTLGYLSARLGNVVFYTSALSGAQVTAMYNGGVNAVSALTPVGWWKLETNYNDSGSGAHNLTAHGTPLIDRWGVLFSGRALNTKPFEKQKIEVLAEDWSAMLADRQVNDTYSAKSVNTIITDGSVGIMPKYLSTITLNHVTSVSATISKTFSGVSVLDVLQYLADIADTTNGYDFYIDDQKDLHFFQAKTIDTGLTISNSSPANLIKWEFPNEGTVIYNKVNVYGNPAWPPLATVEDSTSQTTYGVKEMPPIVDPSLTTIARATDIGTRAISKYANPNRIGVFTVRLQGLESLRPGYLVNVNIANSGVAQAKYVIMEMTLNYPSNKATIRVNEWNQNLTDMISRMLKDLRQTGMKVLETDNVQTEYYSNHLGATDNFTTTYTEYTGTATTDSTNHIMDLDSGASPANTARAAFETKKTWTLGEKLTIVNMVVDHLIDGTGTDRAAYIGLISSHILTPLSYPQMAGFVWENGNWYVKTVYNGTTSTSISALANGDHLTIVANTSRVMYFKNGTLLATHSTAANIPTSALKMMGAVTIDTTVTVRIKIGIDLMDITNYK